MLLRFTIRDLLWLTGVVALAVGWWVDHRNVAIQREQLSQRIANLEKLGQLQGQLIGLYEHRPELEREDQRTLRLMGDRRLSPEQKGKATAERRDAETGLGKNRLDATAIKAQIDAIQAK